MLLACAQAGTVSQHRTIARKKDTNAFIGDKKNQKNQLLIYPTNLFPFMDGNFFFR
jgi:hypothetical protein